MPPAAVRLKDGNSAALAATTSALADRKLASAVNTSGLRLSNSDGNPGLTAGS